MRISELLALSPNMVPLLIELRVDCIGCSMSRFCTLKTLCSQYNLDIDEMTGLILTRLHQSEDKVL
jgi:hypothetical protein